MKTMHILVTCDSGYAKQAALMLFSLQKNQPEAFLDIFAAGALQEEDIALMGKALDKQKSRLTHAVFDGAILKDAPTTDRYPVEMYYRIFAAQYLPQEMERVLYLDPDLVVTGDLSPLYEMEMGDAFFAAASHVKVETLLEKLNQKQLPSVNKGLHALQAGFWTAFVLSAFDVPTGTPASSCLKSVTNYSLQSRRV